MTLQQYAETVYFPNIKTKKSPSTVKGYLRGILGKYARFLFEEIDRRKFS